MKKSIILLLSLFMILSASGCTELGLGGDSVLSVTVNDITSTSATLYYDVKDLSKLTAVEVVVTPCDENGDGLVAGFIVDELTKTQSHTFEGGFKADPSADATNLTLTFNDLQPGIRYIFNTTVTISGIDYTRVGNFTTLE
ncbi:MAG: hypothetical protein KBT44_05280 [Bacteroidales bacterium]|nr:hypothetical protein [Candidatus Equibacterium intestinale]